MRGLPVAESNNGVFTPQSEDNMILHVDIDAFFASVEQVRNPRLRGRPVIVGSGVIASCSYEARKHGLHAGMPLSKATKLCPRAVVLEGHYPTYRCFSDRVFEICRQLAPHVETHLDEAYCDLSGMQALYGHPANAGSTLRARVRAETGLSVTVGIGANRMIAKMAASPAKPDGLAIVQAGAEEEFVRDLPIEKLPGVGHSRVKVLRALNIATIGELRALDRDSLQALFGAAGAALHERCRGRDSRVINDEEIPKSLSRETSFHTDTADPVEIEGMLFYLTERAARAMRELGLKCRTVGVHIRYSQSGSERARRSLRFPTASDRELSALARQILNGLYRRRANLHLAGVQLSHFVPDTARQAELFENRGAEKLANLYRCLDRLRRRFGHSVIVVGKSLDALGTQRKDRYGFILRTPSLTK